MRCFVVTIASALVTMGALLGCDTNIVPGGLPSDSDTNDKDPGVSFANDIQPIFTTRCAACHRDGGAAALPNIPMRLDEGRSFASLVNQPSGQNGGATLVTPGDSANSLLFQKVSAPVPPVGSRMPLFSSPLQQAEQDLIRDWIDQGANDN
jgi:hypothetical protein